MQILSRTTLQKMADSKKKVHSRFITIRWTHKQLFAPLHTLKSSGASLLNAICWQGSKLPSIFLEQRNHENMFQNTNRFGARQQAQGNSHHGSYKHPAEEASPSNCRVPNQELVSPAVPSILQRNYLWFEVAKIS